MKARQLRMMQDWVRRAVQERRGSPWVQHPKGHIQIREDVAERGADTHHATHYTFIFCFFVSSLVTKGTLYPTDLSGRATRSGGGRM